LGYEDDDVAHGIVYRALTRLGGFRGESKFSTWFYTLAKREGYRALETHIRKQKPLVSLRVGPSGEQSDWEPAAKAVNVDDPISVNLLERKLPRTQAEVIRLMADGYTLEEIAENTGESIGTIRSRYRLAKAKLRCSRKNHRQRVI
jgi:RNA polymerase sigma-70 factor (ECF subfamily)